MRELSAALDRLAPGEALVVGSGAEAGLTVAGAGVEPRHARFLRRDGLLLVRDLGTRLGTFVNGAGKRVALAAELLGDPRALLLDEATSGLDPATEAEMMRLFRSLADEGRTVVCVTHFPGRLHACDRLLYLMHGRAVFCGPPAGLAAFFGVRSIEDAYVRQGDRSADEWRSAFERSPEGRTAAAGTPDAASAGKPAADAGRPDAPSQADLLDQPATLTRRHFDLQRADWPNLLLLLGRAPAIGLMIAVTFGDVRGSFAESHAAETKEVIFTLVLAVLWCSGTASVREIVKDEPILRHEARFGVRPAAYLASKVLLLSGVALTQAFPPLLVVRHFTGLTGGFALQYAAPGTTSVAGVAVGLLVSSFAGTSERAMTPLPVLLIAQAIFSGGLARLEGAVRAGSRLLAPAYWALDGLRSTFSSDLRNATYPGAPGSHQPPTLGAGGPLPLDLAALALQAAGLLALTLGVLASTSTGTGLARRAGDLARAGLRRAGAAPAGDARFPKPPDG